MIEEALEDGSIGIGMDIDMSAIEGAAADAELAGRLDIDMSDAAPDEDATSGAGQLRSPQD